MSAGTQPGQRSITALAVIAVAAITPLLSGGGVPAATAAAPSLCGPPADTVPPQVTSVSFNRHSVDLAHGPRTVTVTAHATDGSGGGPASGIRFLSLRLKGPGGLAPDDLSLRSGTPTDGVWRGTARLPKRARAGTWRLNVIHMSDKAGNQQVYGRDDSTKETPTDISLHPDWDQTLTLSGAPPPSHPTRKPGTLPALRFTPTAINTRHRAEQVTLRVAFNGPRPRSVGGFVPIHGKGAMPLHPVLALKRTTGNHWRARFTVKRWAGDSMAIPRLQARYGPNVAPDIAFFNHRQLRALHLAHSLRITSRADLRRPVLTALRVSPATVDTRSAAGHLTVTAKATDHRSGVSKIQVDAAEFASAGHTGDITSVTLKRQGMKWVGTMTFRQCVPAGSWQFTLFVFDHARNGAGYGPKRLSSLGLPAQITVRSNPQHLDAPAVNGATASAKHHTIRLNFSDGVKNVTPATLSGFALQPAATRFHSSLPITGITCSDGAGTADCSGTGGLVTSALLDVPDVAAGQQYEVFANIHSITSQLTDNFGNPLDWSRAAARVTVS